MESWITGLFHQNNSSESMGRKWYESESWFWKEKLLPKIGYVDPSKYTDWTFKYTSFYKQKLDWILLRNCKLINSGIEPLESPDHKPIWVEIDLKK